MQPDKGEVSFNESGMINVTLAGENIYSINASGVTEALVKAGVGCGLLYIKLNEDNDRAQRILCRFTMSGLKDAGELCKIINFYVKTKKAVIPEDPEVHYCKKCERQLMEGMTVCLFCYDKVSVFKMVYTYLKPYLKTILSAQSFLTISSALFLITVLFNRHLIDNYFEPRTGTPLQIVSIALIMLAARILGEVIFIFNSRRFNRATINFSNDLRVKAYEKVQILSLSSLSKRTSGDMIRRIMEDTSNIREFLTDAGRWAIDQTFVFIVAVIIMMVVDFKMTLLVLLPMPIVAYALTKFWRLIIVRYERQWRKESRCQSILHDIIKGIRTVKSFGTEELEINKFSNVNKELAQVSSNNEVLWA